MFGYVLVCLWLTDVAMNTLVTEIEKEDKIHIMSSNHGFFSLGGFIGAGFGGFFLSETNVPLYHLYIVIVILLVLNLIVVKYYYSISSNDANESSFQFKNFKPLLVLAFIAFFVMASEGAIVDWSALYLEKVSLAKLSWIGLGYTAFSATMAFARFLGDIGFGFVGLGLSVIIPELFRLAGKTKGVESSQGISFVSGIGFFGFLIGPVLLGFLADVSSLKLSFIALLSFIIISFLLAFKLKR